MQPEFFAQRSQQVFDGIYLLLYKQSMDEFTRTGVTLAWRPSKNASTGTAVWATWLLDCHIQKGGASMNTRGTRPGMRTS